ncbi:V-type K+-independent H+-translocating inorganic pyrophosphatase [Plasmodium gaboni]|uniref:H(+)-exporting diphosphatase n=1 Tax=Plasmodium gaboni TaxID=647221 RepID=A0ABY1URQ6_9APIC|nr:V-type K+-independent H+-translocating inorganic pyrophosphatase [Plasmodium gaboni]
MTMLPLHEDSSTIRKKYKKNNKFFGGETSVKNFLERYSFTNKKDKKKNEKGTKLNILKYMKLYMNKPVKHRITFNVIVFILFLVIIYIFYHKIENVKTVCLISLTLYSLYFLLFSLYMLSTILNDEYGEYSTLKKYDMNNNIYINDNELNLINNKNDVQQINNSQNNNVHYVHQMTNDHNFQKKVINKEHEKLKYDNQNTSNEYERNYINLMETKNTNNDNKGDMKNEIATNEDYETFSFDSIGIPIKEGSEGFFTVQYNSIFKISLVFTLLILFLYIIRGEDTKLPQADNQTADMMNNNNSNSNGTIIISSYAYGIITAISFLLGALCSSIAGYNGIYVAVRANVKVAKAATYSYNKALITCFRSGAVSAIVNVALAILGICSLLLLVNILYPTLAFSKYPLLIVGYGFGASLVAMLYQLAGGIYTKAADIGADLVGKVEKHIPEDDPRNPAVIADLVGDNVGDCAGQCADLFESICAEIIASMILGGNLSENGIISEQTASYFVLFPLFVHSMDLLISTIGIYLVSVKNNNEPYSTLNLESNTKIVDKKDKSYFNNLNSSMHVEESAMRPLNNNKEESDLLYANYDYDVTPEQLENPLKAMLKAYFFTCSLGVIGFSFLCKLLFSLDNAKYAWIYFSFCGFIGMACSYLFVILTRYYTDYSYPKVKKIAHASLSGPATNIIAGLYVGLESTFFPIIVISTSLLLSYYLGLKSNITGDHNIINGLYGTSVATMGMLSTAVFILSMSNFGPIADNAGGIVEMCKQPKYVRAITDKLDAVGNVTKANTKGFSVGSAALACFLLFSAFLSEVSVHSKMPFSTVDIAIPEVFIGGILGSVVVFLFAGWSLDAVGKTAEEVLKEVRRQFNEHPGILTYKEKPDYHTCVAIISKRALIETIKPGLLGVFSPIIVGLIFKQLGILQNNQLLGAQAMASFIMFSTSTGILMALFLNNAGGAWDNAKKYIESGYYGGKNSQAHVSSVIGDTVGDPCKDTAGPSIHVLIKLISTITMVITPLIASTTTKSVYS